MGMSILDHLLNYKKSIYNKPPESSHLKLAGINQKVFLNQWGEPETQVGLNKIGRLNRLGTVFLITEPTQETSLSIWIYKKQNRVLFFTKERLFSHFSFKKFRTIASTQA